MPTTNPDREPIPACPRCHASHVVRNGKTHSGSPNFLCRGCHRRFVADPKKGPISEDRKELIRRLLRERLALRAIARAVGVSRTWLQNFVNQLYREETPWDPGPLKKKTGKLILEADEMWSYVASTSATRGGSGWPWTHETRTGRRDGRRATAPNTTAPNACGTPCRPSTRRGPVVFSDFWAAYATVVPEGPVTSCCRQGGRDDQPRRAVLAARCASAARRFVRKTLSFSKCDSNHIGAL